MKRIIESEIPSYWMKRLACFIASILVPYTFLLLTFSEFSSKGILGYVAYAMLFVLLLGPGLTLIVGLVPGIPDDVTARFSDYGTIGLILQVVGVSMLLFSLSFMINQGTLNKSLHVTISFAICLLSSVFIFASALASLEALKGPEKP